MKVEPMSSPFFIIIIVFAVFIWSLLGEQDASGAGAPEGTVAFLSSRNSKPPREGTKTTVYLIDADGNNERKWMEDPQVIGFGPMAWSPDGKQVAFHIQTDFSIHIFLMDLRTGKRKNLTAHFGDQLEFAAPAWSGDGKWLALGCTQPDGHSDVCIMDVEGKVLQNLTRRVGEHDTSPSWSPDSSKIAYTNSSLGRPPKIYVMDRNGRNQVNLTNHPGSDWHPQWSPDGKKIAFYSDREGNSEIYVMNADGSNVVNLTRHPSEDRVPAWSPDGQWIAFQSDRDGNWGNWDVYVMDANGDNQRRVTNHPGVDGHPTWVIPDSDLPFSVSPQGKLPTVWGRIKAIKSEKR